MDLPEGRLKSADSLHCLLLETYLRLYTTYVYYKRYIQIGIDVHQP